MQIIIEKHKLTIPPGYSICVSQDLNTKSVWARFNGDNYQIPRDIKQLRLKTNKVSTMVDKMIKEAK